MNSKCYNFTLIICKNKFDILKFDLKSAKESIKDLQYQNKETLKDFIVTRKAKQDMEVKVQGLTEGLSIIQEQADFVDKENKLKNTIFILMRENKQLKKQIDNLLNPSGTSGRSP